MRPIVLCVALAACAHPHDAGSTVDASATGDGAGPFVVDGAAGDSTGGGDASTRDGGGGIGSGPGPSLTWTWLSDGNFVDVWCNGPDDVWTVTYDGGVYRLTSGGTHWDSIVNPVFPTPLTAVWGSSVGDIYAVGALGELLHATDGVHLETLSHPSAFKTSEPLYDVWGSGANDVYAVGFGGTIVHSTDGGATWTLQTTNTDQDLHGIWGTSADDVYAVGGGGVVLHTIDRGQTWSTVQTNLASYSELTSVWGGGTGDLWVVSYNDNSVMNWETLLHSADGGLTWTEPAETSGYAPHGVWLSRPGDMYAVGVAGNGSILHSSAGTPGWSAEGSGLSAGLNAVRGSSPTDVYIAADGGLIHGHL